MLAWTIYISFIGVLVLMLLPREAARAARIIALLTAIAGCVVAFAGAAQQPNPGEVTTIVKVPWIPALGASYYLAADGISLVLVVLTGLAAIAGILFSWNIEKRTKEFFAFYLALIGGVYGVFLSFDVLLLFVFYELTIIPKYFLIARWGSTRKEYGAMKLALYSFVGSHLVLIGLIATWVVARAQTGHASLDLLELSKVSFPLGFQHWVFPAGVRRIRDSGGPVAVSHMGAHRSRGRAHRRLDVAGGRGDETRRLRLPARGDGAVPRRRPHVAERNRRTGGHRHCLWRGRGAGAKGFQVCHRLFQRESHGFCAAGPGHAQHHRPQRRGAANVLARHHRRAAVRRRGPHGL